MSEIARTSQSAAICATILPMPYKTLSELLVLLLLLLSCVRIFFIRNVRSDPISIVPLIALGCSVLSFAAFGLSVTGIVTFVLAFFVFVWNIRALLRLNDQLVIDHYGPWFIFISLVNLLLVLAAAAFVLYFRPVSTNLRTFGVQKTSFTASGNFDDGFSTAELSLRPQSAYVSVYRRASAAGAGRASGSTPEEAAGDDGETSAPSGGRRILVFVPGECATVETYEPFFVKLAHDGYTVYAADFYTGDSALFGSLLDSRPFRRFAACLIRLTDEKRYQRLTRGKVARLTRQYRALLDFTDLAEDDFVYLAGDTLIADALLDIQIGFPGNVGGSFDISTIPGYPTPGWGPVEQTSPFLALLLGRPRDSSRYLSSRLAAALEAEEQANYALFHAPTGE